LDTRFFSKFPLLLYSKLKPFLHVADLSPEEAEDVSFKQASVQQLEFCFVHLLSMTYGVATNSGMAYILLEKSQNSWY
jgi:hypothetical protein